MNFETVIGLEVHCELKTKSKMFSGAPVTFGEAPNTNANIVDMGYEPEHKRHYLLHNSLARQHKRCACGLPELLQRSSSW